MPGKLIPIVKGLKVGLIVCRCLLYISVSAFIVFLESVVSESRLVTALNGFWWDNLLI